jgi:hypothetical protein
MRSQVILLAISLLALPDTHACQPLEAQYWGESPTRVKANYDGAKFVVVATVVDLRTVHRAVGSLSDMKFKLERATFRVDRAFKGKLRPGQTFVIDSGMTSCARLVRDTPAEIFIPGKKTKGSPAYPKQWIIYYTPPPHFEGSPMQLPPFEITGSPLSRPVSHAQYDLTILEKIGQR